MARSQCWKCHRAELSCLCSELSSLKTQSKWIILAHPKEARRATSTGRITHLMLKNSDYIITDQVDHNEKLKSLLLTPHCATFLLFPGEDSIQIHGRYCENGQFNSFAFKNIQFIVIDSTWYQAKKMFQNSSILRSLPKVSFSNTKKSNFKFRTQPREECLSTIESVHYFLNILDPHYAPYDKLIEIFDKMVDFQVNAQIRYHPEYSRKWEK